MLDLSYIFPQEPITPGSPIILDRLPDSRLDRYIREALAEIGLDWKGNPAISCHTGDTFPIQPNNRTYIADYNIGVLKADHFCLSLMKLETHLNEKLKYVRWYSPEFSFVLYSATEKSRNLWLNFILSSTPKKFEMKYKFYAGV